MTENNQKTLSCSRSAVYFNAIDRVHELLETHKDLSKSVPSCVVVGMQSVGKSAVLSRVSGIPFPQDSEVCTRVAIELQLRRCSDGADKSMAIKAGTHPVEVDSSDDKNIEAALKKAQTHVLNGRKFEDKISVKIKKEGPDLPEVTLIDLPGVFFAKTDDADHLEGKVKEMINERVRNHMSLIMHVVPLNQDTDTISTWRVVHDADKVQSRTISILTKADLALKDGKDTLKKRIEKIVSDSKASECFIVHGAAKDCTSEEDHLSMVRDCVEELGLGHSVKLGVAELNSYIEERTLKHFKEKVPEMRRLLEEKLQVCKEELDKTGREAKAPIEIAMRDLDAISARFEGYFSEYLPKFRLFAECMSDEVFNIDMQLLGLVNFEECKQKLNEKCPKLASPSSYGHEVVVKKKDYYYSIHALALEVMEVGEDSRDFLNLQFVGKKVELSKWVQQFAEKCSEIMVSYVEKLLEAYKQKVVLPSLENGCSEATKHATRQIETVLMGELILKTREGALEYVANLKESIIGRNLFTTNTHYLNESSEALKKDLNDNFFDCVNSDYIVDLKPYFNSVCDINAFIKTRKKLLPDSLQLEALRLMEKLLLETKQAIKKHMVASETLETIKEPRSTVSRRKYNLEREKTIKEVLREISPL